MKRSHLPLNALRSFEAAARHGVFTHAAEELAVTHGAISRQVAALERVLGTRLFLRQGRNLVLTTAGEALLRETTAAFDRLSLAVANVAHRDAGIALEVNAPPTFMMKWLIPRLPTFQREHPALDLRLTTGIGPVEALRFSAHDVWIRRLPREAGATPGAFLPANLVAACAPHLLKAQSVRSTRDMTKHTLLTAATNRSAWREWFQQGGVAEPLMRHTLAFEEMYFTMQAALDGLGVALLPAPLIADDIAAKRLVVPKHVDDVHVRDYCYVISPTVRNVQGAAAFSAWLIREGAESTRFTRKIMGQQSR